MCFLQRLLAKWWISNKLVAEHILVLTVQLLTVLYSVEWSACANTCPSTLHSCCFLKSTGDVLHNVFSSFGNLRGFPWKAFSSLVCCSELSFLVAPSAHTLVVYTKFTSSGLQRPVFFSVSHDPQLERPSVCNQILPHRQQGTQATIH